MSEHNRLLIEESGGAAEAVRWLGATMDGEMQQIVRHARQELVRRLDGYEVEHPQTFHHVIEFIEGRMMPIVVRHAISGVASINSEDPLFDDSTALAMLIDIFSERGFHTSVDVTRVAVPLRFDLQTGEIFSQSKKVFKFNVRFRSAEIRS